MDSSELKSGLNDLQLRLSDIREGVFDVSSKENRLQQIEDDLAKEEVWSDLELSQKISKEKTALEKSLTSFKSVEEKVSDGLMFIDIAEEDHQIFVIVFNDKMRVSMRCIHHYIMIIISNY